MLTIGKLKNQIVGNKLYCYASEWNGEDILYHFKVQHNGINYAERSYTKEASADFILNESGIYSVYLTVKEVSSNQRHCFPAMTVEYLPTKFDWDGVVAERIITQHSFLNVIAGKNVAADREGHASTALIFDCYLIAKEFSEANYNYIGKYMQAIMDDSAVDQCFENDLNKWKQEVAKRVNSWVNSYGIENVILLRYMIKERDEADQAINWMLEELYDYILKNITKKNILLTDPLVFTNEDIIIGKANLTRIEKNIGQLIWDIHGNALNDVYIDISMNGNVVSCNLVNCESLKKGAQFAYYLLRYENIVTKTGYSSDTEIKWQIDESGIYVITCFIKYLGKVKSIYSKPVSYMSDQIKEEYKQFRSRAYNMQFDLPQYVSQKEPYCDYAVISASSRDNIQSFDSFKKYDLGRIGGQFCSILTEGDLKKIDGHSIFISGIAYVAGKQYYHQDISTIDDLKVLESATGCFTLVHRSDECLLIHSDYFNFQQIYYYRSKDFSVFSNRYHLILSILQKNNIRLELYDKKASIQLSSTKIPTFTQGFLREMDMRGVYQLDNALDAVLNINGWSFIENTYGKALKRREVYHEKKYKQLLIKAKDELLCNLKGILTNKRYTKIHMDLTGGLDSRMIYAALTLMPIELRKKVDIVTIDVPGSNDLNIALQINSIYRFPWNSSHSKVQKLSQCTAEKLRRSFYMGRKYDAFLGNQMNLTNCEVNIIGACGEILARPYIPRRYYDISVSKTRTICEYLKYITQKNANLLYTSYEGYLQDILELMGTEMQSINVPSPEEKIEKCYLMYRHAYHFEFGVLNYYNNIDEAPLQLKCLFRAHNMTDQIFRSIKMQLDMLYLLNPMIASIDFDSKKDNDDRKMLLDELNIDDVRFQGIQLETTIDKQSWICANEERIRCSEVLQEKNYTQENISYDALKLYLKLINYSSQVEKNCGIDIYYLLKYALKENSKAYRCMYNKILSLIDQIAIVGREKENEKAN